MKIYFACSITGGREFEGAYQVIVGALGRDGFSVPNAHLAESGVPEREAGILPHEVYERDVAWIRECEVLVAEVSVPSHGVGYEIGYALGLGKRVLAIHDRRRKVSKMISGNPNPLLQTVAYVSPEEAVEVIKKFLRP